MSFLLLALIVLVGLLGPLVAARSAWKIPIVIGELLGGLLIGESGLKIIDPAAPDLQLLATIGFGLTMVVVGSQIPVRDIVGRSALLLGLAAAGVVGVAAAVLGAAIAAAFGTGHGALYTVLLASSSAALVLPMLQSLGLHNRSIAQLVAQIAIADVLSIVALPFAVAPARALAAAGVTLAIGLAAIMLYFLFSWLDHSGLRRRLHEYSERRRFALELRFSLLILFGFAAIAELAAVSMMLAGFALGLLLSAAGEPRRLARQLFGMTEGFFSPLFFVWLGASINLGTFIGHPRMIILGVTLGLSTVLAHMAALIARSSSLHAVAASGQLGVPVAAVALGVQAGFLDPGEDGAILLGALITVALSAIAVGAIARRASAGGERSAADE